MATKDNESKREKEQPTPADNPEAQGEQREGIIEMGSVTTRSSKGIIHCLTIVGQIVM